MSPVIPPCIHGWLGRNTRERYSHPVGSNSIHAPHISPVQCIDVVIIIIHISVTNATTIFSTAFCHHCKCLNRHYKQCKQKKKKQHQYLPTNYNGVFFMCRLFEGGKTHTHYFVPQEPMVAHTWEAPGSGKQSTLSPRGMLGQVATNALVPPGKKMIKYLLKVKQ